MDNNHHFCKKTKAFHWIAAIALLAALTMIQNKYFHHATEISSAVH